MFLEDVFIIQNLQVLAENSANKTMKIRGIFQRADEENNNGRIYPKSVLEGQLAKLKPLIAERRLCGELDHPQNDTVRLSNASHLITNLYMKGNDVFGEAELLGTPAGMVAQALIKGKVKIGISSRGMGTLSENENGQRIVNEDFNLVTFDLVADPSTRGAYPGVSESKESKFVQETKDRLEREYTLLKYMKTNLSKKYKVEEEEEPGLKIFSRGAKAKGLVSTIQNIKKNYAQARLMQNLDAVVKKEQPKVAPQASKTDKARRIFAHAKQH